MDLFKQRAAELAYQKKALRDEYANWRARSAKDQPLEKHHTQIERITRQLDSFLSALGEPQASFPALETYSRKLLGAHRIWSYYRSKLALRDVEWAGEDLKCADEFAWECYRPARDRAEATGKIEKDQLKEPPLVFFTDDASPFLRPRESGLRLEGLTPQDSENLKTALLTLPIPLIGIPWFQVHHMPSAAVIGHEVGHAIEVDFDLTDTIKKLFEEDLKDELKESPKAWQSWRRELFADLYGVLCVGPAHVVALSHYLATDLLTIQKKQDYQGPDWGRYPNHYLRMLFNVEVLDQCPFKDEAQELKKSWVGTYKRHAMKDFEQDIPTVATGLLDCPMPSFGGVPVRDVISFSRGDQATAVKQAERINAGLTITKGTGFRHLVAAATLAFLDNPAQYEASNGQKAVVQRMLDSIPKGVRSVKEAISDAEIAARDAADERDGRSLLDMFS